MFLLFVGNRIHQVYNGITDEKPLTERYTTDTLDHILNLILLFTFCGAGDGGLSCRRTRGSGRFSRVAARVLPGVSRASLCTPLSELNESTRLSLPV